MRKLHIILPVLVLILLGLESQGQTAYGYLGKRFYIKGSASASPSLLGKNLEGQSFRLRFNVFGTGSFHMVLNRKSELVLNYKNYASIASLNSTDFLSDALDGAEGIGEYRFRTNEFGLAHRWFGKNLDAPQGVSVSLGLGLAFSKYDTPIQAADGSTRNVVYRFDNTQRVTSPIIRFGIGKQSIFWNRLIYDFGVDVGLNTGFFASIFAVPFEDGSGSSSYNGTVGSQEELDRIARASVQRRLFFKNLINFRMGLGFLLF